MEFREQNPRKGGVSNGPCTMQPSNSRAHLLLGHLEMSFVSC